MMVPDGLLGRYERVAEVAACDTARPVQVLHHGRAVGAVLVVVLGDRLGRRVPPEDGATESPGRSCAAAKTIMLSRTSVIEREAEALGDVAGHRVVAAVGRPERRLRPPGPSSRRATSSRGGVRDRLGP